jgi:hypothetical protein
MSRVAPAARRRSVIESIAALDRLRREMASSSEKNKPYDSYRRVLDTTIRDLRKSLHKTKA